MATTQPRRRQGRRLWGGWASFLVLLLLGPTARPWAGALTPRDIPSQGRAPRVQVAVQQGRLSVDLREAEVAEVLAQIHQQTGIPILVNPSPREKISVQFTGVALDQGLRRLLQLASRSYAMRYAPDPTGGLAIQEVRVFGEAHAGSPDSSGAERVVEEPMAEAGQRFVDALMQRQAAAPSVASDEEEDDMARRFRDAVEASSEPAPWPPDAPESEAARRFRDALEGATEGTPR
jgi:hypothetical protein